MWKTIEISNIKINRKGIISQKAVFFRKLSHFPIFGNNLKISWKIIFQFPLFSLAEIELFFKRRQLYLYLNYLFLAWRESFFFFFWTWGWSCYSSCFLATQNESNFFSKMDFNCLSNPFYQNLIWVLQIIHFSTWVLLAILNFSQVLFFSILAPSLSTPKPLSMIYGIRSYVAYTMSMIIAIKSKARRC